MALPLAYSRLTVQPDLYDILDCERAATDEELKKAYRRMAMRWHPDRNPDDPDALQRFKEVAYAYQILSDPVRRLQYDRFGRVFTDGRSQGPFGTSDGEVDLGEVLGGVFRDLFGRRKKGPSPRDLRYTVTITLEEAAQGTTKHVEFSRQAEGGAKIVEKLAVKVPAGVDTGQKLKVAGKGFAGRRGTGDLFVVVNVADHSFFRRRGADVFCDVPVTFGQIVLGAELDIPTLLDPAIVRLPPGCQPGTVLTLKGRGLPWMRGGGRGNQFVKIVLDLPTELTSEQKEQLLALDRDLAGNPSPTRERYQELLDAARSENKERAS